jgi:two-component system, OmpR family, phosphate regulon response regulator PhoB
VKASILIVEDDSGIQRNLRLILEADGHKTRAAASAEDALVELRKSLPDLILLDVRLPEMDGFELCRKLRSTPEWRSLAVIFLTSRNLEASKVLGLGLGGDDYIVKPFSAPELLARINSVLRRRFPEAESGLLSDGFVTVDREARAARAGEAPLKLTPTQLDLLALLIAKKGKALSRSYLMENVWGRDYEGTTRTIDTHIYNLRKALGKAGDRLKSVGATGYKWSPDEAT